MVIGTTLLRLDGSDYFSPQFGRGGLAATFSVDVTHVDAATTLNITVQHRNTEDTAWTDVGSFAGITSDGSYQLDLSDLKEVLRIKYGVAAAQSALGVHFLMQAPSWRPY